MFYQKQPAYIELLEYTKSKKQKNRKTDMQEVNVRSEMQQSEVAGEVSAQLAVVRPILEGLLRHLKRAVVIPVGGYEAVTLEMLARLYRPGDGDCGICFEYAVHDAVKNRSEDVMSRIADAAKKCKVPGSDLESILFGVEKKGTSQLIATAADMLTDDSRLLTGKRHQPPKLRTYLNQLAAAFRRPSTRLSLPTSINGLWKADLFLGTTDEDRWVGTTVKINRKHLEAANGLRIAIVPEDQGKSDAILLDKQKNLVICPMPYDSSFMEIFYAGWGTVSQVLAADAQIPKEVNLPLPAHRQVARELVSRRAYPVVEIVEALMPISQPQLIQTQESTTTATPTGDGEALLDGLICPVPIRE